MSKTVYAFEEGKKEMKEVLGGKGANLAEMVNIGIPVPPGFTITTEVCKVFHDNNKKYPEDVKKQIEDNIKKLEKKMGAGLGDKDNPLLVSVRSGAALSMPGMMDTILNIGLNDETVVGLAKKFNDERMAWDSYRRFIQMFGNVVLGIEMKNFESLLEKKKHTQGVKYDTDLSVEDLKKLVAEYKEVYKKNHKDFPVDAHKQLQKAINAVFLSWNTPRAISYRRINHITGLLGTAVNVQAMVFGNSGENSGTGVFFTRNPSTGENEFYGEFLMNAQGEDVVAGIRTPRHISELKKIMPDIYQQLVEIYKKVEKHYKDMQDMEFTIQDKILYILQTRVGKRTAEAEVKIAVDMFKEKLIDQKTAVLRVNPNKLAHLLHPTLDMLAKEKAELIAVGLPASPGAAVGQVVFNSENALKWAESGKEVILVRLETSPEDIEGMNAAKGVLTSRGGMTSHAAVVARGMGKACIVGCEDIVIDESGLRIKDLLIKEGDYITLNGSSGKVYLGKIPVIDPELSGDFATIMEWADKYRKLGVRTNADTPHDSEVARKFGAEGIGLCRTEHMFFEGDRIKAMREMIIADSKEKREKALAKLLPMQQKDFEGIFKVMEGLPVTIRLLDPPLNEFLPHEEKGIRALAKELKIGFEELKDKVEALEENNPMLGHRGCRLAISYPEILEMQVTAIIQAALNMLKKGVKVEPEIMIPLVSHINELKLLKGLAIKKINEVLGDTKLKYKIGTMIETPRAALTADEIAKEAEFFSFGTNDLTQMTFGFSRDDFSEFVPEYIRKNILEIDPFAVLDQNGVGQLIKMAVEKGRKARPDLKLGICGEHGGEPSSVLFSHSIGLDYVSCSPYRVPVARLAAAHAALK
ncbi:MAG: pyruvate, phosphate dikinase [archaeon]